MTTVRTFVVSTVIILGMTLTAPALAQQDIITTVAGNGVRGFNGDGLMTAISTELCDPVGVVVDAVGNLIFTDATNHRVRKVDTATTLISTIAGSGPSAGPCADPGFSGDGGPATAARLFSPHGIDRTGIK